MLKYRYLNGLPNEPNAMESYYSLLGLAPNASLEEIEAAYQRQRERYSPERVAAMGEEFAEVANQRLAELERARTALLAERESNAPAVSGRAERSALSRRELTMLVGGALIGLLLIIAVWNIAGRSTTTSVGLAKLDRPAPAFELRGLDGQPVRLEDYSGKVVLVNFWYSECAPCQEETPALQKAYQQLAPEGLVIVGVNVRGNEPNGAAGDQAVRAFVQRYGVSYPIGYDDQGKAGRDYQVLPLPSSFFIDAGGTIRYASYSTVTADEVERVFNELQHGATAAR